MKRNPVAFWLAMLAVALVGGITLYLALLLTLSGQLLSGAVLLGIAASVGVVYTAPGLQPWRFVLPAVLAVAIFIVLPVVYTAAIGFTNHSARNLLTFDAVRAYHLAELVDQPGSERQFALTHDGRIYFPPVAGAPALITQPLTGRQDDRSRLAAHPFLGDSSPELLALRAVVARRAELKALEIETPGGTVLRMDGLRQFSARAPRYRSGDRDTLIDSAGTILVPDHDSGFYRTEAGEQLAPGWRVSVGWSNFLRIIRNQGIREPVLQIFIWTCAFAFLSMVLTFALGTLLAVILNWPHLAGRAIYRVLLILPYAVPAFLSILIFRGLFNQNFGEINLILEALLGFKPAWFASPWLAKLMVLIVNTWLGYPYWMLLVSGFLQAVPKDLYKAAALDGAGSVRMFLSITLPQILPPSVPLLVSNFAFNFNNIVLILLLTRGGPDIPGTIVPAGATDILGSFTFRIAFQDSGQDFGLAGAISLLIFLLTGMIALINMRVMQHLAGNGRARQ